MHRKQILAILTCLMFLISSFAVTVFGRNPSDSAYWQQEPMDDPIIMWAVITTDPYWGYYGGYHDMMFAIQDALLEIGIDLRIKMFEPGVWWDIIWEDKWNVPGDADNNPGTYTYGVDGWDFFVCEWWLNPTSYIWFDELSFSELIYPEGWNIMPFLDDYADYLYEEASTADNEDDHIDWMHLWQAQAMHNPPVLPIYYAEIRTAEAIYIEGYDQTSWMYELTHLRVDQDLFNTYAPPARKALDLASETVVWAAAEPIWAWNPVFTLYYTEEMENALTKGGFYRNSREDMETPSGNYIVEPQVAADWPTWTTAGALGYGTYPADTPVAQVPIREDIVWTDGVPFNATDVAFSWNAVLSSEVAGYARGDYILTMQEIKVQDEYTVDFIMHDYDYDFANYTAHNWGIGWIPEHQMRDVPYRSWSGHDTNSDPIPVSFGGKGLECIGPYVPVSYTPDVAVIHERFDVAVQSAKDDGDYSGTIPDGYSWTDYYWDAEGWGPNLPKRLIAKLIPDAADRLIALQNLEIDFGEYPTAPLETYDAMREWDTHKVLDYAYPASNPLWFNLDNPILSNRYVRQAIAHAIPYQYIYDEILPGWGVSTVYPGKTWITPWHDSFDWDLLPYETDIDKAKEYMEMWRSSQLTKDHTATFPATDRLMSPVGDADFSGEVKTSDFPFWVDNLGITSPWPQLPGNDIDPDFDNLDDTTLDDYFLFRDVGYGNEYPFPGAR